MLKRTSLMAASRARQSLNTIKEETNTKRFEGEEKMIRSLSRANETASCLVTPRSTFSGEVDIQLDKDKATRIKGRLIIDTESTESYLAFQVSPHHYQALENRANHGPIPIKIFYDNTPLLRSVEDAMVRGLNTEDTLLGYLFCNHNIQYRSIDEFPPPHS